MSTTGPDLLDHLTAQRQEMVDLVTRLVEIETPSDDAAAQAPILALLTDALGSAGLTVEHRPGTRSAGQLVARAGNGTNRTQVIIGHADTVWPVGTLDEMPVKIEDGRLHGPGTFDMKAGVVQAIFALRALGALGHEMTVDPVFMISTDEEIGSPESRGVVQELAREADRVFVVEPALEPDGRLKSARKGVGRYTLTVTGKASHAGLDPRGGHSAIHGMSRVVDGAFALNDFDRGVTVNVGTIEGGSRHNVIAAECSGGVDVRALTRADADAVDAGLRALDPGVDGTSLHVDGGFNRPPMEFTPGAQTLWSRAAEAAAAIGIPLDHGTAGGGSDGNLTAPFAPTLDGLGAVGAGAHAAHEHVLIEAMPQRAALLAMLLLGPALG